MRFRSALTWLLLLVLVMMVGSAGAAIAQESLSEDAAKGKTYFQQSCAICHADHPDAGPMSKQGPSLVDLIGRRAGAGAAFNYSKALTDSGLLWDAATLDRFLANPNAAVPGTTMPMAVPQAADRVAVVAYLKTLHGSGATTPSAPAATTPPAAAPETDDGDWRHAAPGVKYRIKIADLPPPFATSSAGNGPRGIKQPEGAMPSVPPGFSVRLFASGLSNPRIIRVAPNGDIFIAETGPGRIRVLRAASGAEAPSENQVYAESLDHPFGIAFYPPGPEPKWVYVANNNAVVRFPYQKGDLKATGAPEIIVPKLSETNGGHTTRDVAFSLDGKRMFISVGSGSNVAEGISKKSPEQVHAWEAEHGLGAAWDGETNRADILVTDPEGRAAQHPFATGIRNGVGIAVNPLTGDLWTSANERDGLGDNLVPDYITRVKEGGYYGWPWYYLGNHEDPRLKGHRPDLAGKAIVPDVPVQAHSASLGMCFYTAASGVAAFPKEYQGDVFAAFHGSWNRKMRTGYKVIRVHLENGVPNGEYEDFLTGFVADDRNVWGRPVGVAVAQDGALLVTEDNNGTVWRVSYQRP